MRIAGLTLLALGLAGMTPALGADIAPVAAPEVVQPVSETGGDWRFQATFYGWLSGVEGDVGGARHRAGEGRRERRWTRSRISTAR